MASEGPTAPCDIDFVLSFLSFRSTRVSHTPRLQLAAVCRIIAAGGEEKSYYLSVPCIGEKMYVESGLIHHPPCEFSVVFSPGEALLMNKHFADGANDVRELVALGKAMPTHGGGSATVTDIAAHIAKYPKVRPFSGYAEFRDALLNNYPINARTTFTEGHNTIVLEYPALTVNVAHDKDSWQVDAGPLLFAAPREDGQSDIERLYAGYVVWNRFDYAEVVWRGTVPLSSDIAVNFFHHRVDLGAEVNCRNELFSAP